MRITLEWLKEQRACDAGIVWFRSQEQTNSTCVLKALMDEQRYDWANWLIVQMMTRPQFLAYAIFSAEQVIGIYEKKYPGDARLRNAIEAARKVLEDDTLENRAAARAARAAAWVAAAEAAAGAAAGAAEAAAWAAGAAAGATAGAAAEAAEAAAAAGAAGAAARIKMQTLILNYGIKLLG